MQPAGFGYQQQLLPGIRPGMAQMQNFMLPFQLQRQSQQGQRMGGRRGGAQKIQQQQQVLGAFVFPILDKLLITHATFFSNHVENATQTT